MTANKSLATMSAALLVAGSTFYICFRPKTLVMFKWAEAIGAGDAVNYARVATNNLAERLPSWAIHSMPFALYVLSYMLAIESLWEGSRSAMRLMWLAIVPVMAIISELAQAAQLIPGTFDKVDLGLLLFACTAGVLAAKRHGKDTKK